MTPPARQIAFGPVPSRRLGKSLGINNIGNKTCSYSCIYCQVGKTPRKRIQPRGFYAPSLIRQSVASHIDSLRDESTRIDYLTFVPDGETTLDRALGDAIDALRDLGIPIAVITNASLLWREEVRRRLGKADLVSIKVDSVLESAWRKVNRPHPGLELGTVLQGIRSFSDRYAGTLISETMLINGINDSTESVAATADFLADIAVQTAYIAVPIRPTATGCGAVIEDETLVRAYALFSDRLENVELLSGHETGQFSHTGDASADLLAITAVHPMRESAVRQLLAENQSHWDVVDSLIDEGALNALDYAGERFYLRPLRRRRGIA